MRFNVTKLFIILASLIFFSNSYAQKKDKNWLLVDMDYAHLHPADKYLIDSILPLYHQAKEDTDRLILLDVIVENCNDETLWPKYNLLLLKLSQEGNSNVYLKYQAAALNNIGYEADNIGDKTKAIDYYNQALKIRELSGDKNGTAESYNNLASVLSSVKDDSKAEDYYSKAVKLYEECRNEQGLAYTLTNLGNLAYNKGDIPVALKYNTKAMFLQKKIGDKAGLSNSLSNLANIYSDQNNDIKAIDYYEQALQLREEVGDKSGVADAVISLGEMYYKQKDILKATEYATQGLQTAQELGFPLEIRNAADLLSKLYKTQSKMDKALFMYQLYIQMRDSIDNTSQTKAIAAIEFKAKEAEMNIEYEKQTAIAAAESKKQKLFMWLIACVAIGIAIIAIVVFRNLQVHKKAKRIIERQKELVEEKQKEILDSIRYAKRIQDAVLKEQEHVSAHLPGHFVLFQPKDIVSGDFYWAIEKDNHWYVAAADCTGHGVPGAFLTILGTSFLNEINATESILTPAQILDSLRKRIISELSVSTKEGSETKDGMDISLARLNLVTKELMWAGANNPLWITSVVNKNESIKELKLTEIPAHKQPIGFYPTLTPYPNHVIQLQPGDTFYLFTDGYADQFGGEKGKKLKYKPIKEILLNPVATMEEQKQILLTYFSNWKGNYEQTDDVCIIGITI